MNLLKNSGYFFNSIRNLLAHSNLVLAQLFQTGLYKSSKPLVNSYGKDKYLYNGRNI
jgi:hypothetical protein